MPDQVNEPGMDCKFRHVCKQGQLIITPKWMHCFSCDLEEDVIETPEMRIKRKARSRKPVNLVESGYDICETFNLAC